jgi:hypothetical protein
VQQYRGRFVARSWHAETRNGVTSALVSCQSTLRVPEHIVEPAVRWYFPEQ